MDDDRSKELAQYVQRSPELAQVMDAYGGPSEMRGAPPVIIHMTVPQSPPTSTTHSITEHARARIDPTAVVVFLILAVMAVVVSSMLIVACHETPQVRQYVDKPNCKVLC